VGKSPGREDQTTQWRKCTIVTGSGGTEVKTSISEGIVKDFVMEVKPHIVRGLGQLRHRALRLSAGRRCRAAVTFRRTQRSLVAYCEPSRPKTMSGQSGSPALQDVERCTDMLRRPSFSALLSPSPCRCCGGERAGERGLSKNGPRTHSLGLLAGAGIETPPLLGPLLHLGKWRRGRPETRRGFLTALGESCSLNTMSGRRGSNALPSVGSAVSLLERNLTSSAHYLQFQMS
jgi:hypothetical protein